MTDEEILATADACGLMLLTLGLDKDKASFFILAFAKQIAKLERHHEREACAKVCETRLGPRATEYYGETYAEAIRARGEQA
jgi:hypothetical protein